MPTKSTENPQPPPAPAGRPLQPSRGKTAPALNGAAPRSGTADTNLPATSLPPLPVPAAPLVPIAGNPAIVPEWTTGGQARALTNFSQVAAHVESAGRYGGAGLPAVVAGLDLVVVSGLTLKATAGAAIFDAEVNLIADSNFPTPLVDGEWNYCWFSDAGQLKIVAGNTTPPTPSRWAYLGAVPVAGGVPGTPDYSGRLFRLLGGMLQRVTGDATTPSDNPGPGVELLSESKDGLYLWDGVAWRMVPTSGGNGDPHCLSAKNSVRVATAAALPAYTRAGNVLTAAANGALATVDGVTLGVGDRLLLKDGANPQENGIFVVTQVGDGSNPFILTRAPDADTSAKLTSGSFVLTGSEGAVNAKAFFELVTPAPIVLNTTPLTWTALGAPPMTDLALPGHLLVGATPLSATPPARIEAVDAAAPQIRLTYDSTHSTDLLCGPNGNLRLLPSGGKVGINTTSSPARALEVVDAVNPNLRLTADATHYIDFNANPSGQLTINPTSGLVGINVTGTPGRALEIVDAANPQLRLSQTAGANYADLQTDATGTLIITSSFNRVGIFATPVNNASFGVLAPTPATVGSGNGTSAPRGFWIQGGAGGNTSDPGTASGGNGGNCIIAASAGGSATAAAVASTGAPGGFLQLYAGAGGNAAVNGSGNNTGGQGNLVQLFGGAGGNATGATTGTNTGGAGAGINITAGNGGNASGGGTNVAGAGGGIVLQCGTGGTGGSGGAGGGFQLIAGNATGDDTVNRAGGAFTLTCGNSKGSSAGGAISMTAGAGGGGTAGTGAAGGAATLSGGAGGIGSSTPGASGIATLQGGVGAAQAGSAGGNAQVLGGAGTNTGSGGSGGQVNITGADAGGDNSVARAGGSVAIKGGASRGNQLGGAASLTGGIGSPASSAGGTTAVQGGAANVTAGAGGANNTGGLGGVTTIAGGAGGNGTVTNGNGGNVFVRGGAAGAGGGTAGTRGNLLLQDTGGLVGIGTTSPVRILSVLDATNPQLRLVQTANTVYTDFQTDSSGRLTVTPTGSLITLTGDVTVTGRLISPIPLNAQAASYSLVATDAYKVVEVTNAGAVNVTIDAATFANVGDCGEIFQAGAGQLTVVAGGSSVLRSRGNLVRTAGQYATIAWRKKSSTEIVLSGDLA